jgi:DNA-binding response OmpR family regulator
MKKTVLIADNLRGVLDRKKTILERTNFDIVTTTSGENALAIHKAQHVDIIIASLDLPDISGDKLCSIIRKEHGPEQVSVILICSNEADSIERASKCGANAYITKPFRDEELAGKLTRMLSIAHRQSYRVLLKARVRGKYANDSFYCSSHDISSSGIMIETDKSMEKGDILSCSFFLPAFGQISAEAEVMRIDRGGRPSRYGLRFRNLDPVSKAAVEDLIASRSGNKP